MIVGDEKPSLTTRLLEENEHGVLSTGTHSQDSVIELCKISEVGDEIRVDWDG